ncbi:MAG TPA: hypothetical protein VGM03_12965 [Phycisphaerae bacterium]|jgi:hypothetical protein
MTQLLKQAFEEASRLEELEQNAVARWLLDELASERRWERAFAESQEPLRKLANEALAERRAGRTQALDPDAL